MHTGFVKDEDGAQVIEYALIIAVLSVALILVLEPLAISDRFSNLIDRVSACLTTGPCT